MQDTYILHFENVSHAEANRYAEELRNALLDASADIEVQRQRSDPLAQDFGATLVLVLGTPAAAAVVTAISNWLRMRRSASLTIETPQQKVIAQNITSADVTKLAQLFLAQQYEEKKLPHEH